MRKLAFLVFFLIGCGDGCCSDVLGLWVLEDASIELLDESELPIEEPTVVSDSLFIQLSGELSFVYNNSNSIGFGSSLLATSCPDFGFGGPEDPVTTFRFTSSQTYNGIPSGDSLNDFIRPVECLHCDEDTIEEWLTRLNRGDAGLAPTGTEESRFFDKFILKQKPANNNVHTLTLYMETHSGVGFTLNTMAFSWE